jgi:nitroreductase/NAD-dependent dihydropyrimidine dehydrogenase PreA subunit
MELIQVNTATCKQCGICAATCPGALIDFQPKTYPRPGAFLEADCVKCGHCVAVCPTGSLSHWEHPVEKCPPLNKDLQVNLEECEQLLKSRRSIRAYKDQPVPRDVIQRLIEIARYAPTGHNNQELEWRVIDKRETLQRFEEIGISWMRWMIDNQPQVAAMFNLKESIKRQEKFKNVLLRGAPVLVVTHAAKGSGMATIDSAHALAFLDLAAKSMGLGCCWAGFAYVMANGFLPIKELLALPESQAAYGCMILGYPRFTYQRIPLRHPPRITWHSK